MDVTELPRMTCERVSGGQREKRGTYDGADGMLLCGGAFLHSIVDD